MLMTYRRDRWGGPRFCCLMGTCGGQKVQTKSRQIRGVQPAQTRLGNESLHRESSLFGLFFSTEGDCGADAHFVEDPKPLLLPPEIVQVPPLSRLTFLLHQYERFHARLLPPASVILVLVCLPAHDQTALFPALLQGILGRAPAKPHEVGKSERHVHIAVALEPRLAFGIARITRSKLR